MDNHVIKIQKVFRGYLLRSKRLPLILYVIQDFLSKYNLKCSFEHEDGRINSCIDETNIINILRGKYDSRIQIPKIRMWYDILVKDICHGWIPVNIKTTKMNSRDNIGNLALCIQSYTNFKLDLTSENTYENGLMSVMLIDLLKNKQYNRSYKKDYYFIVINKIDSSNIIVNSIKGLVNLTPNINNLPFQICWNRNKDFVHDRIDKKVILFLKCFKLYKSSWKINFIKNVRKIKFKDSSRPRKKRKLN